MAADLQHSLYSSSLEGVLQSQNLALELTLKGAPLNSVLKVLAEAVEKFTGGGVLASILLLSEDGGTLHRGAAPNLPETYNQAIDGIRIGPRVGSCGTAAYFGKPVMVTDIASDPLWSDFRDFALAHELRACWSTPIFSSQREVLGTFAIYSHSPGNPNSHDQEILNLITRTAALVIERSRESSAYDDAKAQLMEERHRFATIFADASTSMAVVKGPKFIYEKANRAYLDLFHRRSLLGKPLLEALPELKDQPFPALFEQVFATGIPYVEREARAFLKRHSDAPLEERYFDQTYSRLLDAKGQPYGVFIHAVEVTDRVLASRKLAESEDRLRIAIDAANMGTWDYSPQTGVVHWSKRTNELFGVPPSESIHLEHALQRIHPDDRQRVEDAIQAAIDPYGSRDYNIEYRILHDDGQIRWVSLRGRSHFVESNGVRRTERFSGTVIDVTERAQTEAALRKAKEGAEAASAAKSAFLANMSHEIRTPLGVIMGFTELLAQHGLTREEVDEYLAAIDRNSSLLLRVIDDILDLSKVEAGRMVIENLTFSLAEFLSDFSALIGLKARENGINFHMRASTPLPTAVETDPARLRQILMNVVGNAIKFTEKGLVEMIVSYAEPSLSFTVIDTGQGISSEQAAILFQPFVQADVSTTRRFGGTGLGLFLTKRLCENMGGNFVLAASELGQGSTFVANIRASLPDKSQLIAQESLGFITKHNTCTDQEGGRLAGLKILVVDDSPDNQSLIRILLSKADVLVEIASDGHQGVKKALAGHFDILLMDVQMPRMDGHEATWLLRQEGFEAPIVAMTAHAMKEERQRCVNSGFSHFLSKPIQRASLFALLEELRGR